MQTDRTITVIVRTQWTIICFHKVLIGAHIFDSSSFTVLYVLFEWYIVPQFVPGANTGLCSHLMLFWSDIFCIRAISNSFSWCVVAPLRKPRLKCYSHNVPCSFYSKNVVLSIVDKSEAFVRFNVIDDMYSPVTEFVLALITKNFCKY